MYFRPTQFCLLSLICLILGCTNATDEYHAVVPEAAEESADSAKVSVEEQNSTELNATTEQNTQGENSETSPSPSVATVASSDGESVADQSESGTTNSPMDDETREPTSDPKVEPASKNAEEVRSLASTESASPLASTMPRSLRNRALMGKPGKPLEIKLLIPHKEFTREGPENAIRVTFDDLDLLKVCNMEPVPPDVMEYLPDWLKNLNGKKILLRGWMFPSGRQEGISSFMFVRDNGICCFGRDPKVYDKLAVTMQPGKTTKYIAGRPFDVEGTLLIEPDIEGPEEGLWWLYRIENARVIDH